MWRILLAFLFPIVATTDYDGEIRWRFVFRDPRGGYMCRAIMGWVHMNEDGMITTPGHSYCEKWVWVSRPLNPAGQTVPHETARKD